MAETTADQHDDKQQAKTDISPDDGMAMHKGDPTEPEVAEINLADDLTSKLHWLRKVLEEMKGHLALFIRHPFFEDEDVRLPLNCVPGTVHTSMRSNMGLVFRHLEDARMRTGKALQAMRGGVSILDKPPFKDGEKAEDEAADSDD